jgi:hypothetical protein
MLLTFPILFAMWALLSTAIELRGAPFFGWIHDLTAHDPYFVTPLLMENRFGFSVAGVRVNYYSKPVEDALVLWREGLTGIADTPHTGS